MVKVVVNQDTCIGCGACEAICPKTFKIVDGKSKVIKIPAKITCEQEAAESCPVNAITVTK